MLGWILYIFTILTTFLILALTPVMLLESAVHRDRRMLRFTLAVLGGFIAATVLAWNMRPADWPLPLWQTAAAAVDVKTYGHPVEHAAEQLLVFLMFAGDLGALAVAATMQWRLPAHDPKRPAV